MQGTGRRLVVFALGKGKHTPPPGLEGRSFIVPGPRARARRPAPYSVFGCGVTHTARLGEASLRRSQAVVLAGASPRPSPVIESRGSMPESVRPCAPIRQNFTLIIAYNHKSGQWLNKLEYQQSRLFIWAEPGPKQKTRVRHAIIWCNTASIKGNYRDQRTDDRRQRSEIRCRSQKDFHHRDHREKREGGITW